MDNKPNTEAPKAAIGSQPVAQSATVLEVAKPKLPALMEKAAIKTDQDHIRTSLVKLDQAIHTNAVQCLMHAQKHGDTSLFRRLLIDIVDAKSGYRRQGLIAWMRRFSPMELSGDVIKLSGTINGKPIPWDVETANITPFTNIPEFNEMIPWKPVFKGGVQGQLERALKNYKASVENTLIKDGKVAGPVDPKKQYYSGIHLDKMDAAFDKVAEVLTEMGTFSDDTAEVEAARKAVSENTRYLKEKEAAKTEPAKA